MKKRTKKLFVHWHIYKNAGSSIERLLWESFGDAFAVLDARDPISSKNLQTYLQQNPHIKAISSHRLHPPLALPNALPIVMLRHPADRARSVYRYAQKNTAVPDHAIASTHSFRDYIAWSLSTRGEGAVLRNHQVQHLSNAAYRQQNPQTWQATPADLEDAEALLQTLPAFGLVRRFAQSCRLFNAAYRPSLPAMQFHDWAENETGNPRQTEAVALAEIRVELGSTYEALCAANTLDLAFYESAKHLFEIRLHQQNQISARLAFPLRLLAGRLRRRLTEPAGGLGSRAHPLAPAYVRLPSDTTAA